MLDSMPQPSPRHSTPRAVRARDAGLRRVSALTRVLVVGSVAGAAAFSALAAWAQPGRTKALHTAAPQFPVIPPGTFRSQGFATRSTAGVAAATHAAVTSPQTVATMGAGNVQQLSPPATTPTSAPATTPTTVPATTPATAAPTTPATVPATAPAPSYQYVSPPPVVVSGAS